MLGEGVQEITLQEKNTTSSSTLFSNIAVIQHTIIITAQDWNEIMAPLIPKVSKNKAPPSTFLFIKAGMPLMLFCVGASLVLKSGIEGKHKESDMAKGAVSQSERKARLEEEQDNMMEKITKIRKTDFDNTRRIERPEEILERRKYEREKRNVWYRRAWRTVTFQK
jgi:hypothetical protein